MSWGERSCKWLFADDKPCRETIHIKTCHVDCPMYKSNGNKPDSISKKNRKENKTVILNRPRI